MKEETENTQEVSRVLLTKIGGLWENVIRQVGEHGFHDASAIHILVEELITRGALEINLPESWILSSIVDTFPLEFRSRIRRINTKASEAKVIALCEPIVEEFHLKSLGVTPLMEAYIDATTFNGDADGMAHFIALIDPLIHYIVALDHQLEVDVDLSTILISINGLRQICRNPRANLMLAELQRVFTSYNQYQTPALRLSSAKDKEVSAFINLLEDKTYISLSAHRYGLGIPLKLKRSITLLKRLAKKLTTTSPFKQFVDLGAKGVSASTKIPEFDSETVASLFSKSYFPPIVSMTEAVSDAQKLWQKRKPKPIPITIDIDDVNKSHT